MLFFGSGLFHEKRLRAVSFFNGSVAGLRVGAPVTFRGVPVGEVKSLGVRVMPDGQSIIQVNMELVPGMVAVYGADRAEREANVPALVKRGLTAKLVTQSFVTGLLNVELAFRPGAAVSSLGDTTATRNTDCSGRSRGAHEAASDGRYRLGSRLAPAHARLVEYDPHKS